MGPSCADEWHAEWTSLQGQSKPEGSTLYHMVRHSAFGNRQGHLRIARVDQYTLPARTTGFLDSQSSPTEHPAMMEGNDFVLRYPMVPPDAYSLSRFRNCLPGAAWWTDLAQSIFSQWTQLSDVINFVALGQALTVKAARIYDGTSRPWQRLLARQVRVDMTLWQLTILVSFLWSRQAV